MAQFRYSAPKFQNALIVAGAMTAVVAGIAWMIAYVLDHTRATFWTLAATLIFFAFVSLNMVLRYFRHETVLAVQPTGLLDIRHSPDTVPWDAIRDIVLRRHEDEFELDVYLWELRQGRRGGDTSPAFTIALEPLDTGPEGVIRAIGEYRPVHAEDGSQIPV